MNSELLQSLIIKKLQNEKQAIQSQWNNPVGTPTRHFYIDNLLPEDIATAVYEGFPKDGEGFYQRQSFRERKKTFAHLAESSPVLGEITKVFQLPEVIDVISKVVDFDQLEADASLYAGGLSMMFNKDFLNPHIDNSHDANRKRYRRLNLLYYVSPEWCLENGGNFELWDDNVKQPKTIVSKFNRLVVMETNDKSWHSVSPVVEKRPRCCVSNYYFSKVSPSGQEYFHVTSFTGRPEEYGKRAFGVVDNLLRNTISKVLKVGRGRKFSNKE